ncbi:ABC transporter [uncultured Microbacterium sp.]|uniref:ABC transporter n=1 Tax=uncultured Microbacterium sp. TaxID=191216 RepID=UPI0028D664AB|nr:ABC transporter [uncultured Microbacterium sp.]
MRSRITTLVVVGTLALSLSACAGDASVDPAADPASESGTAGHGAVEGAEEVAEPPLGLTTIDAGGQVAHLDLLDESVTDLGTVAPPSAMATDGRYLFADSGSGVEIVDSGVWTWDHVDHFHYYRAAPRLLGTVGGHGSATVATTNSSTSGGTGLSFADSGDAVLLDTEALSRGEIHELFRLEREPHDGLVVPIGSFALVTRSEGGEATSVIGYDSSGGPTGLVHPCPAASGTITTRVGAVIGCADGALLARVDDGALSVESIPYPQGVGPSSIGSFDNREGRPTVAALAGPTDIRLLGTRERSWTLLTSPVPLAHVTAVDDEEGHLLALAQDGRMLVLSAQDASLVTETEALVGDSLSAGLSPTLIADQHRAYLSAPAERRLYEIDFADGARIARVFDTATEPAFVAETGR